MDKKNEKKEELTHAEKKEKFDTMALGFMLMGIIVIFCGGAHPIVLTIGIVLFVTGIVYGQKGYYNGYRAIEDAEKMANSNSTNKPKTNNNSQPIGFSNEEINKFAEEFLKSNSKTNNTSKKEKKIINTPFGSYVVEKDSSKKNNNKWKCGKCNTENSGNFCESCGAKKPEPKKEPEKSKVNFCPNCGVKIDGNQKFCTNCGTKLS